MGLQRLGLAHLDPDEVMRGLDVASTGRITPETLLHRLAWDPLEWASLTDMLQHMYLCRFFPPYQNILNSKAR